MIHLDRARFTAAIATPLVLLALILGGCGSDETGDSEPAATTGSSSSPESGSTPEVSEEFTACLEEQGVELPSEQPSQSPGAGAMPSLSQEMQTAMQACASLAPSGAPGGEGAPEIDQSALDAFADCMGKNGVKVDATLDAVTQLDQSKKKVSKALETCSALIQP